MVSVQYLLVSWMVYLIIFSFLEFDQKKGIKPFSFAIFMGFAVLDLLRYWQVGGHHVQLADLFLGAVSVMLVMLYALQGYQKISMWILVITSFLVASFTSLLAAGFLLTILDINIRDLVFNHPMMSLVGLISGLILFQIFKVIIKRSDLKLSINSLSKKDILMMVLFLGMFGFYVGDFHVIMNENTASLRMMLGVVSFLVRVIPLYGMIYIATQKARIRYVEKREKARDLLFEKERISYQKMNERHEEVNVFKHGIDDELDYLYQLAQNNDLDEISAHIAKMKDVMPKRIESIGPVAINTSWYVLISNEKYAHVQHEWLGKLPPHLMMDNRDMVRLFSNLFKNAFEAAAGSKIEKYVKVSVIARRNRLLIMIRNSYSHEIKAASDGTLKTTKLKKEVHGIGTKVIKEVVAAYGGKIKYDYDGEEFVASVAFGASVYQSLTF